MLRMRTTFRQWCYMVHGQSKRFFPTIHASMSIGSLNLMPLLCGQIIDRGLRKMCSALVGLFRSLFLLNNRMPYWINQTSLVHGYFRRLSLRGDFSLVSLLEESWPIWHFSAARNSSPWIRRLF